MPLSAVFHTSSLQKQVAALSDAFAIAGEFLHCDVINSGHINMTFRATYRKPDGTTRRYIFQRVNDAVFPCPRDVMHNVEKVTNHIRWKMLRVLKTPFRQTLNLYSARGGRKYLEIPGSGFWRCYNCIENTHTFDVADHPRQAYEAARAFGAFQQLLCDMNPEDIHETIPFFHHTRRRFDHLEKAAAAEIAAAKEREQEALAELEKALAEARLKGQNMVMPPEEADTTDTVPPQNVPEAGTIDEEKRPVQAPSADEPPSAVVRKVKTTSDYFNTLAKDAREPKLIQAIIDEDIKAVDGSRIRLRLLDDVEIDECVVKRGTYLYATVSEFSSGRVKGNINSILVDDELVKVSLALYDTDGMEGLYVPNSQFRETSKDVASSAMSGNMSMSTGTTGNSLAQWGMQAVNNAYQKTSNAISKAIKKNKVKLKYGTFVYLVNGQEKRK